MTLLCPQELGFGQVTGAAAAEQGVTTGRFYHSAT